MEFNDPRHSRFELRYQNVDPKMIPAGESLKDTVARVLPLWSDSIVPALKKGERVLIVAHGNSLRALMQHLEGMTADEIMQVNLPTGIPMMYLLNEDLSVHSKEFIGDPEDVKKAIESVANQGKAK
jgi:2,3-bisphosphoglycerate-dependent phosphoglycerate mutase